MSPHGGDTVGGQLQRSLDLLHQLYLDVEAAGSVPGERDRIQQTVEALRRQPNLQALPRVLLRLHSDLAQALQSIRSTRETIQSYSLDRLRDSHVRLSEVSSTTETATMEMLNGLDRTLAMIDRLECANCEAHPKAMSEPLRNEVNQLYGHLQFQDIITQQLRGVGALLVEVEERVDAVARLFDDALGGEMAAGPTAAPDSRTYDPDASMRDASERQAVIDAALQAARQTPDTRTSGATT